MEPQERDAAEPQKDLEQGRKSHQDVPCILVLASLCAFASFFTSGKNLHPLQLSPCGI